MGKEETSVLENILLGLVWWLLSLVSSYLVCFYVMGNFASLLRGWSVFWFLSIWRKTHLWPHHHLLSSIKTNVFYIYVRFVGNALRLLFVWLVCVVLFVLSVPPSFWIIVLCSSCSVRTIVNLLSFFFFLYWADNTFLLLCKSLLHSSLAWSRLFCYWFCWSFWLNTNGILNRFKRYSALVSCSLWSWSWHWICIWNSCVKHTN